MSLTSTTIRPGLLVGLKTSIVGNVSYAKTILESDHEDAGSRIARWETERRIADAREHEAATTTRSKARALISGVCARSAFGLLCPESRTDALEAALAEARKEIDAFNAAARLSRINLYVITGRIAPDDVEAVRAINSEVADLLSQMEAGIKRLDVKSIREAAGRARGLGQMLSPQVQARVADAVDAARLAARKIVRAGEAAAQEVDTVALRQIASARTAFLDLDAAGDVEAPCETARAIDLAPDHDSDPPFREAGFEPGVTDPVPSTPTRLVAAPIDID